MLRTLLLPILVSCAAAGCAASTQPFAGAPASRLTPAPAVQPDINSKVDKWQTVVYANRRPSADVVFYGLADWRDAITSAKTAGATQTSLIFVFDGPALVVSLNDAAFNRVMGSKNGNPWKSLVTDLQKSGAQIEACGGRMKELGVGNADLLPGVKVDNDGWLRVMDLQSKGYALFQT
ncbi:MAG: DsrE family protein [Planctomycetes bacterium]|nr:DsrE family protein [Planctomycetota bacterium]